MKLIFLFLLFISSSYSYCCTCMTFPTEIDSAKVVNPDYEIFVGKIIGKKKRMYDRYVYYEYKVKVKNKFTLNSTAKYITLSTPKLASACGYKLILGQTYLITSRTNSKNIRTTSICLRNSLLREATAEIELIERDLKSKST